VSSAVEASQPKSTLPKSPLENLGGWLFRRRTALPVPLALLLLAVPARSSFSAGALLAGLVIASAGEALRLWGVHHIGVISRTRSDRTGPLVDTGPFAFVRNPLYLGNIALWAGFAVAARLYWLAPIVVVILAIEYHAIVRWEEQLLLARLGEPYRDYMQRVPRWLPFRAPVRRSASAAGDARFSWRDTLYSERGTLIAVAVACVLLYLKDRVSG
jgi:protein-S-isoprenylcysteine O-methyltransferase Ste14